MCGITGLFSRKQTRINRIHDRISAMTDSMIHRGPDSSGYYVCSDAIAMGHRRLKIIDLSDKSSQPMSSHDKRYTIVFNGEIYNYKEIRDELSTYSFESTGDTEVIIAAIETNGLDWFLSKANGMFSIGVFDSIDRSILLIRDRLGVKPLYYAIVDDQIIFGSEIKAILSSGLMEAHLNEEAIDSYLSNRYVVEPYTFFKNIFQVKAGCYLKADENLKIEEIRYWERPVTKDYPGEWNEEDLLSKLDELLLDAVRIRLNAHVPMGTYLSGGVDSSLITAMASIVNGRGLKTFTIGFDEVGFNEFEYANIVAQKYQTDHHEIVISKDEYLKEWDKQILYKDAPLGVPNEIPLALMTKELKKDISVVLSGEGADELFAGYGRIFRLPFDWENHFKAEDFVNILIDLYEYTPRYLRDQTLKADNQTIRCEQDAETRRLINEFGRQKGLQHFFHEFHIKGLLNRLDANTMQSGVEARGPFLDYRLVEFVYREIPMELMIKWGSQENLEKAKSLMAVEYSEVLDTPKYILKKIAEKYLPAEVIYRKKMGFPVPLNSWFGDLEALADKLLKDTSWLKEDAMSNILNYSRTSSKGGQVLWMYLNVEIFRRLYFERSWRW